MEHTRAMKNRNDRYVWHNKAPNTKQLETALTEI